MPDPRVRKLAHVLINYSLKIKPEDKLVIEASPVSAPLVREAYREAICAGAHVAVHTPIEGLSEILFKEASDEQLSYVSDMLKFEYEHYDAYLTLWGTENTKSLSGV